jgi:hypothetical protein
MGAAAAVAGIGAAGSLASAGLGMLGANKAADASKQAAQMQQQMYLQTRADLSPYNQAGQQALPAMNALALGSPTGGGPDYVSMAQGELPLRMTQAELEQTPGYQWQLAQGLKAVQSSNAARGLGVSGAALKGAAQFATGLASANYQQQFANQQQRFTDINSLNTAQQGNLTNQFNRINNLATLGANAAAQVGTQGTALANQAGNALQAAGTADAAGLAGIGKSITGGVQNALGYYQFQQYMNKQPTQNNYGQQGYVGGPAPGSPTPIGFDPASGNTWTS